MHDNKIDIVFKNKIQELSNKPWNLKWDKKSSWERLQKKRTRRFYTQFYFYAAAILIIGIILSNLNNLQFNSDATEKNNAISSSFEEYEKRQKLAEIEARMSGNYTSISICYTCDAFYYQVIKEDRPVKFRYFEIN